MLIEQQIFDDGTIREINKIEKAIQDFRDFEDDACTKNPNGFYVCDSGGKDSAVITYLAWLAGVKFEIYHNHTTCDHPTTVRHVRNLKQMWSSRGIPYIINYPMYKGERTSMWKLIKDKALPTRLKRYCCAILKETGGHGRFVVTGVRSGESVARKNGRGKIENYARDKREKKKFYDTEIFRNNDNHDRRQLEFCYNQEKAFLNPILSWTDEEVWEFIKLYNIEVNPLYSQGYHRVGCVGCPMSTAAAADLAALPKFKQAYTKAAQKFLDSHPDSAERYGWTTGEEMVKWWLTGKAIKIKGKQMDWDDYETTHAIMEMIDYSYD